MLTPVVNSIIRIQEYEADHLRHERRAGSRTASRASALKLSDYRKIEPGPLEEIIFYDHPSGRTRIFTAMRWKAEHPEVGEK